MPSLFVFVDHRPAGILGAIIDRLACVERESDRSSVALPGSPEGSAHLTGIAISVAEVVRVFRRRFQACRQNTTCRVGLGRNASRSLAWPTPGRVVVGDFDLEMPFGRALERASGPRLPLSDCGPAPIAHTSQRQRSEIRVTLLVTAPQPGLRSSTLSNLPRTEGHAPKVNGGPDTIRTYDLPLRRGTLYPAELRGRGGNRQRGDSPTMVREIRAGPTSDQFERLSSATSDRGTNRRTCSRHPR